MNIIFRAVAGLLTILLSACLSQSSAPSDVPALLGLQGESRVALYWNKDPSLTYWVFYKEGTSVTKTDATGIYPGLAEPGFIAGLTNGTTYSFLIAAVNGTSPTGPASNVITLTPRLVGPSGTWTVNPPDGLQTHTSNNLNEIAHGILSGVDYFVAVGDATTVLSGIHTYTSPGGVTKVPSTAVPATNPPTDGWSPPTALPNGYNADLTSVLYDGARFVAMGTDGSIITSTDTLTWTAGTGIGTPGMHALAYGAGIYIAVGDGGAIYKNTTGGITGAWILITPGPHALFGVSYVNGIFVAVGAGGALLTSMDGGNTWLTRTPSPNTTNTLHQVAFGLNTYIAVGDAGTIVSSTNGVNWTTQSTPTTGTPATSITANLRTICYGPDLQFIAAGTGGTIVYSTTGADASWVVSNPGSADLNSIVPSDVFITVGAAGNNVVGK